MKKDIIKTTIITIILELFFCSVFFVYLKLYFMIKESPLLIYLGVILLIIIGVFVSYKKRIKEIKGGEEYVARKY